MADDGTQHQILSLPGNDDDDDDPMLPPRGFTSIAIPLSRQYAAMLASTQPRPQQPTMTLVHRPRSSSSTRTASINPEPRRRNGGFTLLLVEDNEVNLRILTRMCEKWDQPYETARNGREAVEKYTSDPGRIRCIMMDLAMPVMEGFTATRLIRQFELDPHSNASRPSRVRPVTLTDLAESFSALQDTKGAPGREAPAATGGVTEMLSPSPDERGLTANPPAVRRRRPRRACIIGMNPGMQGLIVPQAPHRTDNIQAHGFDMLVNKPIQFRVVADMIFGPPETNLVALHGAVTEEELWAAGYPLRPRPLEMSRRMTVMERFIIGHN